jgi:hypothetical protein
MRLSIEVSCNYISPLCGDEQLCTLGNDLSDFEAKPSSGLFLNLTRHSSREQALNAAKTLP